MQYLSERLRDHQPKIKFKYSVIVDAFKLIRKNVLTVLTKVKMIGVSEELDQHEQSKLGIFNQLNFFQFITGIAVPIMGFFNADKFPAYGWVMASLPALISIVVLIMNAYRKYQWAILTYFI